MEDIELPSSADEAFDFATEFIHSWEVAKIRKAAELDEIVPSPHAEDRAIERDMDIDDFFHVIEHGKAVSKDLPYNIEGRAEGINFEGKTPGGKRIRLKIGWWNGYYEIATVHSLRQ